MFLKRHIALIVYKLAASKGAIDSEHCNMYEHLTGTANLE